LLLARELLISGWRAQQGSGGPASWGGKLKTILQFVSLLLLLWPAAWPAHALAWVAGWWLFWPGFVLALTSAIGYLNLRR
jgi:CDP-diacylglycerol---glycerol-3-phosphate 3-phosphatidyltransferase